MVLAPSNRRYQLRGNAKQPQRLFQERNLPCCDPNQHPRTQLWQPVSPFEECPLLLLAVASNGKSLEKVSRSDHCRSRSACAVDLLRSTNLPAAGVGRTCNQTMNSVAAANHPDSHIGRRLRSFGDANPVDRHQEHLLVGTIRDTLPIHVTPTRSDVGVPRMKVTHTPSRVPPLMMPTHTSSTQTVNRMSAVKTAALLLGGAHQVPLEIHIPGSTDRSPTVEQGEENPTRDSEVDEEGGDEYSELSLDEELLVTKRGKSITKSSPTSHSNSPCSEGPFIDHHLFQEAVDLAELYPPLSKFHNSLGTTHDSTWGITTAMLEGDHDANWPSDEERTPDRNSKTKKKLPRRRCHTVDSIRSNREDSVRDAAPTEWEHTGCSVGLEFCSLGRVRQSFFHPVFPGRTIPWQTAGRDDNHGGDDDDSSEDGNDWKWQPTSFQRDRSSKSTTAAKVSMSYKEFQLSSSQTDTTEASSTVEKSCSSKV